MRAFVVIFVGVMLNGCSAQAPAPPAAASTSGVTDLEGRAIDPFAAQGERAMVLLFITNDCPISNAYAPEIHRLCDAYMKQGIGFYLVYADPDLSAAEAKKH